MCFPNEFCIHLSKVIKGLWNYEGCMVFRRHHITTPIFDVASLLTMVISFALITVVLEGVRRRSFLAENMGLRFH